jgi:hypothetical protein
MAGSWLAGSWLAVSGGGRCAWICYRLWRPSFYLITYRPGEAGDDAAGAALGDAQAGRDVA